MFLDENTLGNGFWSRAVMYRKWTCCAVDLLAKLRHKGADSD
jgi:hypothetical protein